ncbi:MAG TPA: fluoride efflux transporter CrcB [Roseiarcus sp.]|nr:fluoride efflux transporter CrcB [Roseiarcus sp.]
MQSIVLVFLGAGAGGVVRHVVNLLAARWWGTDFPLGTLLINVTGSMLMGLLAGWLAFKASANWSQPLRLFVATGVLGGYTTFSTFSLETVLLIERNQIAAAAGYVVFSLLFGFLGLWAALMLMRSLG